MNSQILRIAAGHLLPVLLVFSVLILLRGHNNPGGGFIGGLLAAAAFSLYAIGYTPVDAQKKLFFSPHALIASGLMIALTSGLPAIFLDLPYLTGQWAVVDLPLFGTLYLGTPLWFDIGIYVVVIGFTLTILFSLWEQD